MKTIKKIIKQILIIPCIRRITYRFCNFYDNYFYEQLVEKFKKVPRINIEDLDIRESPSENDSKALVNLVNMVKKRNMLIAEIGSWKGHSTYVLAKSVVDWNGKIFAIDTWKGAEGVWHYNVAKRQDIYQIFRRNYDVIKCLAEDSSSNCYGFTDSRKNIR